MAWPCTPAVSAAFGLVVLALRRHRPCSVVRDEPRSWWPSNGQLCLPFSSGASRGPVGGVRSSSLTCSCPLGPQHSRRVEQSQRHSALLCMPPASFQHSVNTSLFVFSCVTNHHEHNYSGQGVSWLSVHMRVAAPLLGLAR